MQYYNLASSCGLPRPKAAAACGIQCKQSAIIDRSLLYSAGAIGLHVAFFGEGVGIILLDDIECIGNESSILDCSHLGIGTSNCFHNEDVSVLCQGNSSDLDLYLFTKHFKDLLYSSAP